VRVERADIVVMENVRRKKEAHDVRKRLKPSAGLPAALGYIETQIGLELA